MKISNTKIIKNLSEEFKLPVSTTKKLISSYWDKIIKETKNKNSVNIQGIGAFQIKTLKKPTGLLKEKSTKKQKKETLTYFKFKTSHALNQKLRNGK